jgi:hypothetical protein
MVVLVRWGGWGCRFRWFVNMTDEVVDGWMLVVYWVMVRRLIVMVWQSVVMVGWMIVR